MNLEEKMDKLLDINERAMLLNDKALDMIQKLHTQLREADARILTLEMELMERDKPQ